MSISKSRGSYTFKVVAFGPFVLISKGFEFIEKCEFMKKC